MKNIIIISIVIPSIFILSSCSSSNNVAPSQNDALNNVSPNGKEKAGFMQKSMESWIKDEWTPTVTKDEEIQKKYMKEAPRTYTKKELSKETPKVVRENIQENKYVEDTNRNFTLQEYVDKAAVYQKANPSNHKNSNVKKLEAMPVIGK